MIAGYAIRRRGGRLANLALGFLVENWQTELVAQIEAQEFIDLTVRRPEVRRAGDTSTIEWPETNVYLATPPGAQRDFLLVLGYEPHFHWQTYAESLVAYDDGLGVKTLVSLRSSPGSVPHTRPAPISIHSADPELELEFGVQTRTSRYEGPTDIAGLLAAQGQPLGWRAVDLTVLQPYYFPRGPNAAATIAIVKVLDHAFGTSTDVTTLAEEAEEQARNIENNIPDDQQTRSVIADLERQYDEGAADMDFVGTEGEPEQEESSLPSGAEMVEELEKFLRGGGSQPEQ
jgi:hypothetical protein